MGKEYSKLSRETSKTHPGILKSWNRRPEAKYGVLFASSFWKKNREIFQKVSSIQIERNQSYKCNANSWFSTNQPSNSSVKSQENPPKRV